MTIKKPSWFSADSIMVSTAPTCGLTKGGRLLSVVDPISGKRLQIKHPVTKVDVDKIDDKLLEDAVALSKGSSSPTLCFIPIADFDFNRAVPVYYDYSYLKDFKNAMRGAQFRGFDSVTLGSLLESKILAVRGGHGSPSQEERIGDVPYIKVSDLRAGLVNINPTNRIPLSVAKKLWRGSDSGLKAFDLLSPERTSKNIGDFCVLLPGQEQVVTTKEVIVLRPTAKANFDSFYLLWALSLKIVRNQWRRFIFMQTNREDVGDRYLNIMIPIPPNRKRADEISEHFREYYTKLAKIRKNFSEYLNTSKQHHFYVSGDESGSLEGD